ncbi:MAG: helix-turn-helix domain-containing protein [Rhodospirillales bacterium]|nr:helix-turn-helix domain-containing protein [Rhodospirillales bacterium]
MANLDQDFRDLLDAFLVRSGTSGRRFGLEALNDPGFVASLRKGRQLGLRTTDRLLAFMGFAPLGPAFRREVEAFLGETGTKGYVLGEFVLNDPSFVDRLRRGASFRLATVERVRAWMAGEASDPARAAMRAAVAGVPLLGGGDDCAQQHGDPTMNELDDPFLSTRRAAAVLGLSPRTLDRYRASGDGPAYHRFGARIVYRRADLHDWAAARRVPAAGEGGPGGGPETLPGAGR